MKLLLRKPNRGVTFSAVLLALIPWFAQTQDLAVPAPPICRGPYLQLATPNSIWLVWRTDWVNITPLVRYGKSPTDLPLAVGGKSILVKASLATNDTANLARLLPLRTKSNLKLPKLHSAPPGTFQYEVPLTDLVADSKYYYAIYDGDKRLTPPG